jgi:hypothetical protein
MGIEETKAVIGIPASQILVWYRTLKVPDCVSLVRYQTGFGIAKFFSVWSGTVRNSGISI